MDLPVMPPVKPMLAKAVSGVPAADAHGGLVYEPKWDGFRCIAFRDGDDVLLASRSGKPLDRYFPDVVDAVREALPPRCVVDGEIVVARDSRLDFELLSARVHPAASRVARLAQETPAALVVFDVLALGDEDLTGEPQSRRHDVLDGLGLDGPLVHATRRTRDRDVAQQWFEVFEGAGLDGIVAKPVGLPYAPGKRSMLKVKHERTADVVLAGYRPHKDSTEDLPLVGSLLVGLHDVDGVLQFVGAASSFTAARRAELAVELAPLVVTADHPWIGGPGGASDDGASDGADGPGECARPGRRHAGRAARICPSWRYDRRSSSRSPTTTWRAKGSATPSSSSGSGSTANP
ncbi:ATP-dependent DNA ligase [Paraoerskovia sediminicola]|uniref:ATP-dependent DNA ligase n=1 Tax=Paraoerskovia sediminicola TaxID=1138587 RepID=A0ABM8G5Q9_9CELL|nr:ATP-dependent DNA ligase [Paraoerskovia sediminicola]